MVVVGIIQARLGSSRLPGKVMLPLGGVPVLEHDIRTLQAAETVDTAVVATTERSPDDVVAGHARRLGIDVYRGGERDVLRRIQGAAQAHDADVIVRLGGDHPLVEPVMIDTAVGRLVQTACDVVTNRLERSFPRGTAVEAFTAEALAALDHFVETPHDREKLSRLYQAGCDELSLHHLMADEVFDHAFLAEFGDLTRFRVVLDTPADYERLWQLYEAVEYTDRLSLLDVIRYLDVHDSTVMEDVRSND